MWFYVREHPKAQPETSRKTGLRFSLTQQTGGDGSPEYKATCFLVVEMKLKGYLCLAIFYY